MQQPEDLRPMRRKDRQLTDAQAIQILEKCDYGTLSLISAEGAPYAVPVNYVYDAESGKIYIHGAKSGRKIDALEKNPTVFFSAVASCNIVPGFTTKYESVMAEGTAALLDADDEKLDALLKLCEKCYPGTISQGTNLENTHKYIDKFLANTAIVAITPTWISGKANN